MMNLSALGIILIGLMIMDNRGASGYTWFSSYSYPGRNFHQGIVVQNGQIYQTGNNYQQCQNYGPNCETRSYGLTTIEQIQAAIDGAQDGSVIKLDPIEYTGDLTITKSNQRTITLMGDSQCGKSTTLIGTIAIKSADNWSVSSIVIKNSDKAVEVTDSRHIVLANLVVQDITGTAIAIRNGQSVAVNNLVVHDIGGDGVSADQSSGVTVNNMVANDIQGVGLNFNDCPAVQLHNNVIRGTGREAIRSTGQQSGNGVITSTVINGNAIGGEGWVYVEGDNWRISSTVANGAPRNGIVVNGCNGVFSANMCTMGGTGYCIYSASNRQDCHQRIDISNMSMGGQQRAVSNVASPHMGFPFNFMG